MEKSNNNLEVSDSIEKSIKKMAYWSKFLSIIGFIGIGLMVVMAIYFLFLGASLFSSPAFENYNEGKLLFNFIYPVLYIVLAVIYYFPINYMYRFSIKCKRAFIKNDQNDFELGFSNLASSYKFIGVMTIVLLSIYLLIFIASIIIAIIAVGQVFM